MHGYSGNAGIQVQREVIYTYCIREWSQPRGADAFARGGEDYGVWEVVAGRAYTFSLERTLEGEGVAPRCICRLSHFDETWKYSKGVVRYLKWDHLGLADTCNGWYIFEHLLIFTSINICASLERSRRKLIPTRDDTTSLQVTRSWFS